MEVIKISNFSVISIVFYCPPFVPTFGYSIRGTKFSLIEKFVANL